MEYAVMTLSNQVNNIENEIYYLLSSKRDNIGRKAAELKNQAKQLREAIKILEKC